MYNVKITEFSDGTTQIKAYESTVRPKKRKSKPLLQNPQQFEVIPITWEEAMERAEQTEKELEQKKEYSLRSSVSRTRAKIEALARSGDFTHFVTLTYDPKKIDRYDYNACIKKFNIWLNNLKKVAPNLQALFIPEFHLKNGLIDEKGTKVYAIHFHGLIGRIEGLNLQFKGRRKGNNVFSLDNWKYGFSDVTLIANREACCRYIRKYISKQLVSISRTYKNRHRYFKTGLNAPKTKKILIDSKKYKDELIDQYIDHYATRNDMNIVYSTDYSDFGYRKTRIAELRPQK